MKRILDSVHGQILIPKEWCQKIIDTPFFQRLRRIEQNSCRSVFPSARHDRFIHSLGVYHIGALIVSHLEGICKNLPENSKNIFKTYKLACLLHDVGHTPFSHTFEEYFSEKAIRVALDNLLEDEKFSNDLKARQTKLTEHELISAYVAISVYKNILSDDEEINWILLARMIIGLPYFDDQDKPDVSLFENIMIQLIHGTIDADGLDYVCRDSWAGGYHNFSINLERLIETIHISKIENKYQLSFSAKGINEIEGVLNVKNFQFLYVINHHKVLLEQYYLIESMKSAAAYHLNVGREKALYELCDFNIFLNEKILPQSNYKLFRPCDDDFISLMKQTPFNDDIYINGWFSRQFLHSPIWKSKIQFFHTFADVLYTIPVPIEIQNNHLTDQYLKNKREERVNAICEKTCKEFILKEFKLEQEDIIILPIEPKIRRINPDELYVNIDNKPINISKLTHDNFSISSEPTKFCYWYVNLNKIEGIDDNLKCNEIIEKIKIFVKEI